MISLLLPVLSAAAMAAGSASLLTAADWWPWAFALALVLVLGQIALERTGW